MKRLTLNSVWAGLCLLSLIDIGYQQQNLVKISQPVPRPRRDHLVQLTGHHRFADEGHLRWRPASRVFKPDLLGRYSTMVGQRWAMYRRHSEKSKHLYAWGGVQQLFKRRRAKFERLPHSVPYAYWTPHELRSPNAQQVLGEMKRRSPGDALIAFSEMNDQQESLKIVKGSGMKGSAANVIRSEWGSILLTLDSPEPGILVINEAYSPWWRVQVNGEEWLSTERMNYLFQGIRLPRGHHTVRLEYRETPTLIALPLCISMALYVLWINRRRGDRRGTAVNV
jgi:hypothetical protein